MNTSSAGSRQRFLVPAAIGQLHPHDAEIIAGAGDTTVACHPEIVSRGRPVGVMRQSVACHDGDVGARLPLLCPAGALQ